MNRSWRGAALISPKGGNQPRNRFRRGICLVGAVALVVGSASPASAQTPPPPNNTSPAGASSSGIADTLSRPTDNPGGGVGTATNPWQGATSSVQANTPAAQQPNKEQKPQPASPIAAQCDDQAVVDDQYTKTWVGFIPSVVNCAAITSLDFSVTQLGVTLNGRTKVSLTRDEGTNNGKWFISIFAMIRTIAIWTIPPIFFIAVIHAIVAGKYDRLLKSALVYLPISVVGTVVAIVIVQQMLDITDDISQTFMNSVQADAEVLFVEIAKGFGPKGFLVHGQAWMASSMMALGLLLATCVVYIILVLRESAIYIAALFMPILFAMLVWPPLHTYFRRLVEFLVGMILSKIIMVAAIALMVSSMVAATGLETAQATSLGLAGHAPLVSSDAANQPGIFTWLAQTFTTILTFIIIMFAPNMMSKIVSNVAYEQAATALVQNQNRPNTHRKIDWTNRQFGVILAGKDLVKAWREKGPAIRAGLEDNPMERVRNAAGLDKRRHAMTPERLHRRGFRPMRADDFLEPLNEHWIRDVGYEAAMAWGNTGNIDDEVAAEMLVQIGGENLHDIYVNQGQQREGVLASDGRIPTVIGPGGFRAFMWSRENHDHSARDQVAILLNTHDNDGNVVAPTQATVRNALNETIALMNREEHRVQEIVVHTKGLDAESQAKVDEVLSEYNDGPFNMHISAPAQAKGTGGRGARDNFPVFR